MQRSVDFLGNPSPALLLAALALSSGCFQDTRDPSVPLDDSDLGGGDLARRDGARLLDLAGPGPAVTRFGGLNRWAVAGNGTAGGFYATTVSDGRYWTTVDINGDGRPDLIQTSDPTRGAAVWDSAGTPYWKVFLNTGGGFDAPIKWPVPPSGTATGFYMTTSIADGRHWQLVDMTGDGRPDLVQPCDPTKGFSQVWDVNGTPYWKVFPNTGTGFGAVTNWAVPKNGLGDGFYALEGPGGLRAWATIDINGDGRPDLIHSGDPTKGQQQVWDVNGSPYWKVYLNTGTEFANVTNWPVPPSGTTDGFYAPRVASGSRQWQLLDLNGDGKVELVQTADTTKGQQVWDAAGAPYWKVFPNTGVGFAAASNWSVPPSGTDVGFFAVQANQSYQRWSLIDLTGDGRPDLVQTGDTTKTQQVWDPANPYWKVFPNTGAGFGRVQTWALPASGIYDGFYATSESTSSRYWTTLDLNGDGHPDLVQSGDANATAQIWDVNGTPYWKVFPAAP